MACGLAHRNCLISRGQPCKNSPDTMGSGALDKLVWDDLRFFAEVAQQGSLSAAARALGVDHATVGRRLQRLEAMLCRPLFDRRGGGFDLTADGREVLVHAEAMDKAALAVARFGAGAPALSGTIRVTATEALASHYLTPRLAEFQTLHPDIDITLLNDDRNLSIARREADLALRLALPADGDLTARRLTTLGYGLYEAADEAGGLSGSLCRLCRGSRPPAGNRVASPTGAIGPYRLPVEQPERTGRGHRLRVGPGLPAALSGTRIRHVAPAAP